MTRATLYEHIERKTAPDFKKINGKRIPHLERSPLSFTIDNLEHVLLEKFPSFTVYENEWSRKQGLPSYDVSIETGRMYTIKQIEDYLFDTFRHKPLGGHRNFERLDKVHLFLYYKIGPETFNLKFSDVVSPYRE